MMSRACFFLSVGSQRFSSLKRACAGNEALPTPGVRGKVRHSIVPCRRQSQRPLQALCRHARVTGGRLGCRVRGADEAHWPGNRRARQCSRAAVRRASRVRSPWGREPSALQFDGRRLSENPVTPTTFLNASIACGPDMGNETHIGFAVLIGGVRGGTVQLATPPLGGRLRQS